MSNGHFTGTATALRWIGHLPEIVPGAAGDPDDLTGFFRQRNCDWIGLRENLQETIDFPIKYGAFLDSCRFPLNQSIETAKRGHEID